MRMTIIGALAALGMTSASRDASALIRYTARAAAITCVPMSTASTPPPWQQTHGKVYHRGSSLENVVLFCPVHWTATYEPGREGEHLAPNVLEVKYVDPDGSGTQADVLAELKYADLSGNVVLLGVMASNQQGSHTGIRSVEVPIGDVFVGHRLYVQLTLRRSNAGLFPAVYGFTLLR